MDTSKIADRMVPASESVSYWDLPSQQGKIIAAGPITAQSGTVAYRLVLVHYPTRKKLSVHTQVIECGNESSTNLADRCENGSFYLADGVYFKEEDFAKAAELFGLKIAKDAVFWGSSLSLTAQSVA